VKRFQRDTAKANSTPLLLAADVEPARAVPPFTTSLRTTVIAAMPFNQRVKP